MKKLLISGYFIGMFLLTFLVVKATATYSSGSVEIKFRTIENDLSDTQIALHGWTKQGNADYVESIKVKETRTKNVLGWETKIDTLSKEYLIIKGNSQ